MLSTGTRTVSPGRREEAIPGNRRLMKSTFPLARRTLRPLLLRVNDNKQNELDNHIRLSIKLLARTSVKILILRMQRCTLNSIAD